MPDAVDRPVTYRNLIEILNPGALTTSDIDAATFLRRIHSRALVLGEVPAAALNPAAPAPPAITRDQEAIIAAAMNWRRHITDSPNLWADDEDLALIRAIETAHPVPPHTYVGAAELTGCMWPSPIGTCLHDEAATVHVEQGHGVRFDG